MADENDVRTWVDGYLRAWNSNDRADIEALFTEDAEYRTEPYKPPWRGRAAIVKGWLEHRDRPGETRFDWSPVAVTDDVAVLQGTTRYPTGTFSNLWIVRLTPDGRCREFTEFWMEHPLPSG
jgi:ketosteroid isomerase-like protein